MNYGKNLSESECLTLNDKCSYELPHRVHTSKVYPLRSPNGSTIILCGHEQGLLVLWRGGRPSKPQPREPGPSTINAPSKFEVMVIDSDDEEPVQSHQNSPCFDEEKEEVEYDPSVPYSPIIQTLDLSISVEVLHISFPNLPPKLDLCTTKSLPSLLSNNIVVALGCSDAKIRLLTLALMPPSPHNRKNSKFEMVSMLNMTRYDNFEGQIIELSGHSSVPRGVCITITAHTHRPNEVASSADTHTAKNNEKASQQQSHSSSKGRAQTVSMETDYDWELLIASHSADLSGVLLVHTVPIIRNGNKINTKSEFISPYQTHQLTSPAACISFNTLLYPAPQHSEILIADAKGIVRVLNCLTPRLSGLESLWLVSLYSAVRTASESLHKRKSIISAQWCLGGKAIIVLYADGEWGIWDVGNAGSNAGSNADKLPEVLQDISKIALTAFSSCGWIRPSNTLNKSVKASVEKKFENTRLAPMTPGTRKARQEALFAGSITRSRDDSRGGVSIYPAFDVFSDKAKNELVLIWYQGTTLVLPILIPYLKNEARRPRNIFEKEARTQLDQISEGHLKGELLNEACLIPGLSPSHQTFTKECQREILFTGEHRIVILSSPNVESHVQGPIELPVRSSADQLLLAARELDVDGIDRMLTNMSNGIQD